MSTEAGYSSYVWYTYIHPCPYGVLPQRRVLYSCRDGGGEATLQHDLQLVGAYLDGCSHSAHVHLLLRDYGEPYGKITVVFGWPAKLETVRV